MELNQDMFKKIRGLILFTAIVVLVFWKSEMIGGLLRSGFSVIFPFVVGAAIAFIMNVPMSFIERKLFIESKLNKKKIAKFSRPIALLLTILFIIGIVLLVIFVVVPQLASTMHSLGNSIQAFVPEMIDFIDKTFNGHPEIMEFVNSFDYDWGKIVSYIFTFLQSGAGSVLDTTVSIAGSLISGVTTFFVAFVFAIYIVLQKEVLNIQLRKSLFAFVKQSKAETILRVSALTYKSFSNYLTGQCVEAVILGMMFFIVLSVFNIPFALLIGVVISFTALIPIFGAFLGAAIGMFLIFIEDPIKAIYFIVIFLILQQVEGNLIYPYVVGNSVGLPAIWVLAAVSIGGSLMGIVGMLIFIPITSVFYALFREIVYARLRKRKINPKDIEQKKIG